MNFYKDSTTIKTTDLLGRPLDWAVARIEGERNSKLDETGKLILLDASELGYYRPSTNWSQGGPIIERENIGIREPHNTPGLWYARVNTDVTVFLKSGPTPLVAAMRCYVASKLGDEVEIFKELLVL